MPAPLEPVYKRLCAVLRHHQAGLVTRSDSDFIYCLEAPVGPATIKAWKGKVKSQSIPVARVEITKNYVSYHLMGIYMNPALQARLSGSLRKHMQGKSCFNFKVVDETLFGELAQITAESLAALRDNGFISGGPDPAISDLKSLGPKSQEMLAGAGITSVARLRELGAVKAWVMTKQVNPGTSLNLLWALESALTGQPWQEVARLHRTSLLLAAEELQRHS
jgi:DNA transformation protein